ncbi:TPA: hypothetical protein ACPSKB_000635 [Legionella feeleii]|uniref:Uncharacterized protein n=1 Tax=Legionella feeleii TaxID=453 RepID=A0A378IVY9_9GAMM|nr:hypothetical protein [Legionella feeleii]STX38705.1 Uncharacterised protein [Legionella feeleii]
MLTPRNSVFSLKTKLQNLNECMGKKLFATVLFSLPAFLHAGHIDGLRGNRYCEILLSPTMFKMEVYNTIGLNDCPPKLWNKISVSSVKAETKAAYVKLNGPRYWVIDGMKNSQLVNPQKKIISGLAMREAGVLQLGLSDILSSAKPYHDHTVDRQTTWVYKAGKPVYELIDPKGRVFVMQSYSVEKTPQTAASLTQLGSKLQLPQGWSYRTGVLKQTTDLTAINKKAVVIQDDFLNTYQLATHDFLNPQQNAN